MDHLQEAKDFLEYSCERWDQGRIERGLRDLEIAKIHALITIAEQLRDIADDTRTIKAAMLANAVEE